MKNAYTINAVVTQGTEQYVYTVNYLWLLSMCLILLSNVQQMISKAKEEASFHVIAAVHDKI